MKLFDLPREIIQIISNYLTRQSICRLCSTCTSGYQLLLPILYKHVELGNRTQIKQLEQGLLSNELLKETVKEYTQILTLKCRQGGNSHWFVISLFEQLPNIKKLYFRDFLSLSIHKVKQVLLCLPRLHHLDFQYCELTATALPALPTQQLPKIKEINLLWTDFSTEAIRQLFCFAPSLSRISLGANHNRKPLANDTALKCLIENCPDIRWLSISLQQVKESSVCQVIQQYGSQLDYLAIRCEGNTTLKMISQHNKQLQKLVIRCNNYTGYQSFIINHILQECRYLNHLEMISWPIHDVPSIILDQINYRKDTLSSTSHMNNPSHFIEGIKRNVALDKHDLQEIRKLYN